MKFQIVCTEHKVHLTGMLDLICSEDGHVWEFDASEMWCPVGAIPQGRGECQRSWKVRRLGREDAA
jgi:hypothetical protein